MPHPGSGPRTRPSRRPRPLPPVAPTPAARTAFAQAGAIVSGDRHDGWHATGPSRPGRRQTRGAPVNGSTRDTRAAQPVPRRAGVPPAALGLLAQARHGLAEATAARDVNERYATAH